MSNSFISIERFIKNDTLHRMGTQRIKETV